MWHGPAMLALFWHNSCLKGCNHPCFVYNLYYQFFKGCEIEMVNRLKHERFQSRFRPFFVSSFRLKRFLFLLLWKTDWILCALKLPVCFIRSACRMVEQLFVTGVSRQRPTISVTFWNQQSNIITHITQWFQKIQDFLKSRALVADMGNPILISSFFILFGFVFLSTFTVILLYIWRSFWKFV